MKHALFRVGIAAAVAFLVFPLASCLSLEAEIDLRNAEAMLLTMHYRVDGTLWELGVFDADSSERAVPVTRRDVEETALRYDDVTVELYRQESEEDTMRITVSYRVGSVESMEALWGHTGGGSLHFDPLSGLVEIPLAPGQDAITRDQREFLREIFAGRTMQLAVVTPFTVSRADLTGFSTDDAEEPVVEGSRVRVELPLAELLSRSEQVSLVVRGGES